MLSTLNTIFCLRKNSPKSGTSSIQKKSFRKIHKAPTLEFLMRKYGRKQLSNVKVTGNRILMSQWSEIPQRNDNKHRSVDESIRRVLQHIRIHKWKGNSQFILEINCETTNKSIQTVGNEISKQLPYLKDLTIDFALKSYLTDEGLEIIGSRIIRQLTNLSRISIQLPFNQKISDKGLKCLMFDIATHMRALKSLEIDCENCMFITDETIRTIRSKIIPKVLNLRSLIINLTRDRPCNTGAKSVEALGLRIAKYLSHLQDLTILYSDAFGPFSATPKLESALKPVMNVLVV